MARVQVIRGNVLTPERQYRQGEIIDGLSPADIEALVQRGSVQLLAPAGEVEPTVAASDDDVEGDTPLPPEKKSKRSKADTGIPQD